MSIWCPRFFTWAIIYGLRDKNLIPRNALWGIYAKERTLV